MSHVPIIVHNGFPETEIHMNKYNTVHIPGLVCPFITDMWNTAV